MANEIAATFKSLHDDMDLVTGGIETNEEHFIMRKSLN